VYGYLDYMLRQHMSGQEAAGVAAPGASAMPKAQTVAESL